MRRFQVLLAGFTFLVSIPINGTLATEPYSASGCAPRENICLNGTWNILVWAETKPDPSFDAVLVWPPTSKGGWYECQLPQNLAHSTGEFSSESGRQTLWRSVGYPSTGAWFRKTIRVPETWKGKRVLFRSGGVSYDATLYVNGRRIGRHRNILPFVFDITSAVRFGDHNQIDLGYLSPTILHNQELKKSLEPGGEWTDKLIGPYGDLYLESAGEAYVDNVNIHCRWDTKTLNATIHLINPDRKEVTVEGRIFDGDKQVAVLPAEGKETQYTLQYHWPDVVAWQPGRPKLYHLELLVKVNGEITDRYRRRFGFREFVTRDGRLYLNGRKIHLICDALGISFSGQTFSPDYLRAYYRAMNEIHINTVRLHGMPFPTVWLDVADEEGMLIIDEGMFTCGAWIEGSPERAQYDFHRRWNRFEQFFRQWVRRDRNHPSVVMWSAENEPPEDFPCRKVFSILREEDGSGRPVFNDGGFSRWADVISVHYFVCPILGRARLGFPYYPDDLYFLDESAAVAKLTDRWKTWYLPILSDDENIRSLKWQIQRCRTLAAQPFDRRWILDTNEPRPLSIGENFLPEVWTLDEWSRFFGDRAYRGIFDLEHGACWEGLGWLSAKAIEAYRYMEVDHFCLPWHPSSWAFSALFTPEGKSLVKEFGSPPQGTPGCHSWRIVGDRSIVNPGWDANAPEKIVTATGQMLRKAYQPIRLIVKPEQRAYFPNQNLTRQFAVLNDTLDPQILQLHIRLNDRMVWDKKYDLPPGGVVRERLNCELSRTPPEYLTLHADLTDNQGTTKDEFRETIRVASPVKKIIGHTMIVFDPKGDTFRLLRKLGLSATRVDTSALGKQTDTKSILVIGEGALKDETQVSKIVSSWTDRGGSVLILGQESFGDLDFAGRIRILHLPNSLAFVRDPNHPILEGINDEDVRLWGKDHVVTTSSVQFDWPGNASVIVDQGSSKGLVHPVVAEFFRGRGRIVLLQCACVKQFTASPIPGRILANAIRYLDRPVPVFSSIVVRNPHTREQLAFVGISSDNHGKVLFVTGKDNLSDQDMKAFDIVWCSRPNPGQLNFLGKYFGPLVQKPAQVNHCQLEIAAQDPLLAGVTGRNLFPSGNQPLADVVFESPAAGSPSTAILKEPQYTTLSETFGGIAPKTICLAIPSAPRKEIPNPGAAMIVLRTGDKMLIVDTIDWETLCQQENPRDLLHKIMTNLRVTVNVLSGGKDTDTLDIVCRDAWYRVNCGKETGRPSVQKTIITQRQNFGMSKEEKVLVAFVDHAGNEWLADQPWRPSASYGYIGGGNVDRGTDTDIYGTLDDDLFRTERWGLSGYKFKLRNGRYLLRLFFAETFDGISAQNQRVFSIRAEGKLVVKELDLFQRVGPKRSLVLEKEVLVQDGVLDIEFIRKIRDACINAIEILSWEGTKNESKSVHPD